MSLWYDIRKKKYSSGPEESWMRSYVDHSIAEVDDALTSRMNSHTAGSGERHPASDIDCADGSTVQEALVSETGERAAAVEELEDLISAETAARVSALSAKVDKVSGKGLSQNDYTDNEKQKLSGIEAGAQVNEVTSSQLAQKVDKVSGKGLSQNDYTNDEKQKLNGIEAGAQVNDVSSVAGKTGSVTLDIEDIEGLGEKIGDIYNSLYKTYGVSIDLSNSNPETAVIYTDDAVGMAAGAKSWDSAEIFKNIRPCLLKEGAVIGYLNPMNFAEFEDGTAADIASGSAGDVMIEIPKMGYKISKSGTTLTVQVTNAPNKQGFSYLAHTRETEGDRDKLYIGAFLGYNLSGKLRSLSGKSPTTSSNMGITSFRDYAAANGTGYDLFAFYPFTLVQCLYLIKYKNLNSQQAIGKGYVANTTSGQTSSVAATGATASNGMDYGTESDSQQMKFLGIEDLWGNVFCHIDGVKTGSSRNICTATKGFADSESYTDRGFGVSSGVYGSYIKEPIGTNEAGFIIKTGGGSATTYFADQGSLESLATAFNGGHYQMQPAYRETASGIFSLDFYGGSMAGPPWAIAGGRIMYL